MNFMLKLLLRLGGEFLTTSLFYGCHQMRYNVNPPLSCHNEKPSVKTHIELMLLHNSAPQLPITQVSFLFQYNKSNLKFQK